MLASRVTRLFAAGETEVIPAGSLGILFRVIVNKGATTSTVELRYADDDTVIATIDAATPGAYEYMLNLYTRGLKATVTGTPDVSILY